MKNLVNKQELRNLFSQYTIDSLCKYLEINNATRTRWDEIPKKYHRRVCEFLKINSDNNFEFIEKLDLSNRNAKKDLQNQKKTLQW